MTIKEIIGYGLDELSDIEGCRLDTELLVGHVLKKDRLYIILNLENQIDKNQEEKIKEYISLRKSGMPIHYILKEREFMGMDFMVEEGVLIPRSDTEILVEETIKELGENRGDDILGIEIGPGSGIISISLLKHFPSMKIIACDINPLATNLTEKNGERHGVSDRLDIRLSDLFEKIEENMKFDIIVSNPPYIRKDVIETLQKEIKNHEPMNALDGGDDGLNFYKRIITEGTGLLKSGGIMAFEIGHDQGLDVKKSMEESGYKRVRVVKDLAGFDRVVIGRKI